MAELDEDRVEDEEEIVEEKESLVRGRSCFVVSGRFITDHARDRVFEFGWEDGVRFLSQTIPEVNYKLAAEILAGRQQLTGDSSTGIDVAPEDEKNREEVADRYRWTYAGIYYDRSLKSRWRPYAYVTSWSADDMHEGRTPNKYTPKPVVDYVNLPGFGNMMVWTKFRCVAYMDDPIEDRVILVNVPGIGSQMVLWKRFEGTVPLWWQQLSSPELAIVESVMVYGLPQERGASQSLRGPKPTSIDAREVVLPKGEPPPGAIAMPSGPPIPTNVDLIRSLIPPGVSDEVADGLARALTDVEDYPTPEPTSDLAKTKWAWVDARGKVYPCRGYMDHIPLAHALAQKFAVDVPGLGSNAERMLEVRGWVKIGTNAQGGPWAFCEKHRTAAQRDVVFDWLVAQNADPDQIKRWVEQEDGYDYG